MAGWRTTAAEFVNQSNGARISRARKGLWLVEAWNQRSYFNGDARTMTEAKALALRWATPYEPTDTKGPTP
jgi:hypothetical protein